MNRTGITRRLVALERNVTTEECGIVRVPKHWGAERRLEAVEAFRAEHGLPGNAQIEVIECSASTELVPILAGNIREIMDYVAKHGRRIGDYTASSRHGFKREHPKHNSLTRKGHSECLEY